MPNLSTLVTNTISPSSISANKLSGGQSGNAPIYGCRAWVNFNGANGTPIGEEFRCTIRNQGNVSKVVRDGGSTGTSTGVYIVTLATPMNDVNYAAVCSIKAVNDTNRHMDFVSVRPESANTIRIVCSVPNNPFGGVNAEVISLVVFG